MQYQSTRRVFLRRSVLSAGSMLAAPLIQRGRYSLYGQNGPEYSARAISLVERSTVIDMLGLLTMNWERLDRWQSAAEPFTDTDFQKVRSSGISVLNPAVALGETDLRTATTKWLEDWTAFIARYPQFFLEVRSLADIDLARRQGRIGIILGLQDSQHFRSPSDVPAFYRLGQRISQLTYNEGNAIGNGCTEREDTGLTGFGASVLRQMNRIGMAVDASHAGERTTLDTCANSSKPVLITHSNCRALSNHPRCKSDAVIQAMARNGGVMGITGIRAFVGAGPMASLEGVLDHFDHVRSLVGVEHIGLGSDTDVDGTNWRLDVPGLDHPRRVFDLTEGLIRRGYTDAHIQAILGGNFRRALSSIWSV